MLCCVHRETKAGSLMDVSTQCTRWRGRPLLCKMRKWADMPRRSHCSWDGDFGLLDQILMNWIKRTIINHIYVYTQPYRRHTSFRDVLWLIGPRFLYCHAWFSEPVPLINAQRGVAGFTMSRDKEYGMIWKEQIRIQNIILYSIVH